MTDYSCPLPESENSEHITVEDASESQHTIELKITSEQWNVSQPVIVHSSLATISAVCHQINAMDLQKSPATISQKQKSVLRTPQIWVPTPKIGVPAHTTTDNRVTNKANTNDRMIHPRICKQIQKTLQSYLYLRCMRQQQGRQCTLLMILFNRGVIPE